MAPHGDEEQENAPKQVLPGGRKSDASDLCLCVGPVSPSSLVGGFQRRDSSYEDFVQEQKKEAARARAQATRAAATTPAPTPAITAVTPTIVHALSADTCTASEVPVPEPSAPLGTTRIKGIARKVGKTSGVAIHEDVGGELKINRDDRPTGADRVSVTNDLFVVPTKQADGREYAADSPTTATTTTSSPTLMPPHFLNEQITHPNNSGSFVTLEHSSTCPVYVQVTVADLTKTKYFRLKCGVCGANCNEDGEYFATFMQLEKHVKTHKGRRLADALTERRTLLLACREVIKEKKAFEDVHEGKVQPVEKKYPVA